MSEFFRELLGGEPGMTDEFHNCFVKDIDEGQQFARRMIELARPYMNKGQNKEGTVLMFAAVLRAVGMIKVGVNHISKAHGQDNPVKKVWDILENVLTAEDIEKAIMDSIRQMKEL